MRTWKGTTRVRGLVAAVLGVPVLALAGTAAVYAATVNPTGQSAQQAQVAGNSKKAFTVSGDLPGTLAPGIVPQRLDLTLSNPNHQDLTISNLTVTVTKTSAGTACDARNFAVAQYSGPYPITLGPGQSARLSQLGVPRSALPTVAMVDLPTNQDGCKGVTVSLVYSGAGKGA